MRTLVFIIFLFQIVLKICAQSDLTYLDKLNYDFFLKKDFKNLKKTAKQILNKGNDYYFLRMRLGILSYEKERYALGVKNFKLAKKFNPFDTICNEYIYYSYLFAGRASDAKFFLKSLDYNHKNQHLKKISLFEDNALNLEYYYIGFNKIKANNFSNFLYTENIAYLSIINTSFTFNLSQSTRTTLQYTNTKKVAKFYSSSYPSGLNASYNQNQLYLRVKKLLFTGFDLSAYTHWVFLTKLSNIGQGQRQNASISLSKELLVGFGFFKNGWFFRNSLNFNFSNFGGSKQYSAESYFIFLPFSNLNLYSSLGGMYKIDKIWGNTYQANFDFGFKAFKGLWIELGTMKGNSFLYSRNFGSDINNSFLIPSFICYGKIIIPGTKFSFIITGNYTKSHNYSWDFINFTKTSMFISNSFGINVVLKVNFNNKASN